ncbi:Pyruvate kinase 2, cytosolic [Camellia lanceoleosa]|uniref:Pyruvate kinase 2, cytosolic n=1 Tax=Camellia lanceoleosa TaxID=1840588 RepID=A0ACC0FYF8_9ERIC|nr:Pyruvate kinase 2, cytosolic [Camellia lanceoleosa]
MQGGQMVVEGPVRLASVLTPSKPSFLPSLTKIVGTLGPNSRSVEVIEACLEAGMSVARFDFSWLDDNYHQETLENLRIAVKNVKRLCAVSVLEIIPEDSCLDLCSFVSQPSCFTWRFRKCHVKVLVVFVCETCLFLLAILKIL